MENTHVSAGVFPVTSSHSQNPLPLSNPPQTTAVVALVQK